MDQQILTDFLAVADRIDAAARADATAQIANMIMSGVFLKPFTQLHRFPKAAVESYFAWSQPGNVGNVGGKSPKPHGSFDWIPGSDLATPAIFSCQAIDWDNFYLMLRLPLPNALPSHLVNVHQFAASLDPIQAIEWQEQITFPSVTKKKNLTHNMGFQFEIPRKEINIYDKTLETWQRTSGIPFPDFSSPVTVVSEFALDDTTTTHVALTINGVRYPVGITKDASDQNLAPKYTTALQLDPKQNASCALKVGNAQVMTL